MSDKPVALPPLGIGDAKSFFGTSRQRIDAMAKSPSSNPMTTRTSPAANGSFRKPVHPPLASCASRLGASSMLAFGSAGVGMGPGSASSTASNLGLSDSNVTAMDNKRELLESLTLIPRDFFVLETNAVLPVDRLAPQKYVSTFNGTTGLWETIVFPALEPSTRNQVLALRDTLEKMLQQKRKQEPDEAFDIVAYTQEEWKIYSICFSELIRQMKFLCKEQSQLFAEVHEHFNAAMKRLVVQVEQLQNQRRANEQRINDLVLDCEEQRKAKELLLTDQTVRNDNNPSPSVAPAREDDENESESGYRCASCAKREAAKAAKGKKMENQKGQSTIPEEEDEDEFEEKDQAKQQVKKAAAVVEQQQQDEEDEEDEDDTEEKDRKGRQLRDDELDEKITTTRVEGAMHMFRLRQEQQRQLAGDVTSTAACAIQKSVRGYLDRHKLIHRKAIEHIIARKRKQQAAVEVLQTTMRSYLSKIRNEKEKTEQIITLHLEPATHRRKLTPVDAGIPSPAVDFMMASARKISGHGTISHEQAKELSELTSRFNELTVAFCALEGEVVELRNKGLSRSNTTFDMAAAIAAAAASPSNSTTEVTTAPSPASNENDLIKQSFERARQYANDFERAVLKLRVKMLKSLQTAARVSSSRPGSSPDGSGLAQEHVVDSFPAVSPANGADAASRPTSTSSAGSPGSGSRESTPEAAAVKETVDLFRASTRAIGLEGIALAELDDSMIDKIDLDILHPLKPEMMSRTTSTSELMGNLDDGDSSDGWHPQRHGDCSESSSKPIRPRNLLESCETSKPKGAELYGGTEVDDSAGNLSVFKTHFEGLLQDDSVWSTSPAYDPPDVDEDNANRRLTVKEKKNKLLWIKKIIGTMYDTLIKQLQEHRWVQSKTNPFDFQAPSCMLAMSFTEWKQHYHPQEDTEPFYPSLPASQSDIDQLVGQHEGLLNLQRLLKDQFYRQYGLRRLVEQASDDFALSVEHFSREDPDVELFRCFFHKERSLDELEFYCYCRYLASRADFDASNGTGNSNGNNGHGNPLFPFSFHHPVADQFNQRDTIDQHHALFVARTLFRVEQEPRILQEDAHFVEIENAIYRKYLPSSCLDQFEQIITRLFISTNGPWLPTSKETTVSPPKSLTTPRPKSPSTALAVHASPLQRRIVDRATASGTTRAAPNLNQQEARDHEGASVSCAGSNSTVLAAPGTTQWICFTEFVHLLLKYRAELNHFHLIVKWAIDLFERIEKAYCDKQAAQNPAEVHRHFIPANLFVDQLYSMSQGASPRELGNIFFNALKQRNLQELMPLRIFVSVVLLMLRNDVISVICYQPLSLDKVKEGLIHDDWDSAGRQNSYTPTSPHTLLRDATSRSIRTESRGDPSFPEAEKSGDGSNNPTVADPVIRDIASGDRSRPMTQEEQANVEKEWMVLARQWRSKEPEFEEAVECIYDTRRGDESVALRLLKQRDHLFQLLAKRGTKHELNKARDVYYDLVYQVNINLPVSFMDHQKTSKATKSQRTNRAAIAGWW